jgi:hypothetical protein
VAGNEADTRFYSRYYPKRLMAEVLHDAVAQVTMVPTEFKTKDPTVEGDKPLVFPAGWRAIQLPDAGTDSYFTKAFGRPAREQTRECERTAEPSVTQALHVANGDTFNKKLSHPTGRVAKSIAASRPNQEVVEDAFVIALCRKPSAEEMQKFTSPLSQAKDAKERQLALEDAYWALLSSREFLFNH